MIRSITTYDSSGRPRTIEFSPDQANQSKRDAPSVSTSSSIPDNSKRINTIPARGDRVPPLQLLKAPSAQSTVYEISLSLLKVELDPALKYQCSIRVPLLTVQSKMKRKQSRVYEEADIIYAPASMDRAYELRARRVYENNFGLDKEEISHLLGMPKRNERSKKLIPFESKKTEDEILEELEGCVISRDPDYPKGGRPLVVIKKNFPRAGSSLVVPFTTYSGTEFSNLGKLTQACSHQVVGSGTPPPLVWQDQDVMVANHAIMIPGLPPRFVEDTKVDQFLSLGTPMIIQSRHVTGINSYRVHHKVLRYIVERMKLCIDDDTKRALGLVTAEQGSDAMTRSRL